MTETLRTRPRPSEPPPTISTTQELPPPPPGRWEQLWERIRRSPVTVRVLIVVPLAAVLVVGFMSGRGAGPAPLPTPRSAAPPTPEATTSATAVAQWQTTAEPVLVDMERDIEQVLAGVAAGEPALAVLQCRDSSGLVATWSAALVPAPDPELDGEVRAALDALARGFDTCSTASLERVGHAVGNLEDAGGHLVRARQRAAELHGD